jgi:hypothetical protein
VSSETSLGPHYNLSSLYRAWLEASERAGREGKDALPRFTANRGSQSHSGGVPKRIAMMISGNKTRSVLDRYNVVDERDRLLAGQRLEQYLRTQPGDVKDKSSTTEQEEGPERPLPIGHGTPRKLLN